MRKLKRAVAVIMTLAMTLGVMSFTAMATTYVCKIGDTEYKTLSDAISKANDGDTITLIDDISGLDNPMTIDKDITLDLNGHTLTVEIFWAFEITEGTVTIKNGTIKSDESGIVCSGGELTLDDVTIKADSGCISCSGYPVVNIKNSSVTATNGTAIVMYGNNPMVNIYSGTVITGKSNGIIVYAGTLNVEGGTITSTSDTFRADADEQEIYGAGIAVTQDNLYYDIL